MKAVQERKAVLVVFAVFIFAYVAAVRSQDLPPKYPHMSAVEDYLMPRDAEITLARSGAPESISAKAGVMVLSRHGYETAAEGADGFVCIVERGWIGALDSPDRWNPKIRGADCLNPAAARSILPIILLRTELVMAGRSREELVAAIQAGFASGKFHPVEPGAMSYMMGKHSYLTDAGGHNMPHLMFYVPLTNDAAWGANSADSPVGAGAFWFWSSSPEEDRHTEGLPPIRVFTVTVRKWSDGTAAPGV